MRNLRGRDLCACGTLLQDPPEVLFLTHFTPTLDLEIEARSDTLPCFSLLLIIHPPRNRILTHLTVLASNLFEVRRIEGQDLTIWYKQRIKIGLNDGIRHDNCHFHPHSECDSTDWEYIKRLPNPGLQGSKEPKGNTGTQPIVSVAREETN